MKNFDRFGVMIDCSRNAVPNLSALKRFIGILSRMGYDCAMLYTEDTYEIPTQPFFGYKRGKYTQAELRELDDYAASVGVELIPCIQTLAHVNALFRWNTYRRIRDCNDILLAGDERTYTLIDEMFASLSSSLRSRKIHIGMDEAHMVGLGKYLDKNGYRNRHEILLEHLNRVCEIARKYGYEPMMWEDMFFRLEFGDYRVAKKGERFDRHFSEEVLAKIPADLTQVYWDYYAEDADVYETMLDLSRELSDKVWFAGGAWCWGGFTPHNRMSIRRNEVAISVCKERGVKNVILTMWGDDGGETPIFAVLPALMNAAAVAEGMNEAQMKEKFLEITGVAYDDMLALDLPNYIYGKEKSVGSSNYSKNRLYNDPFLGILDKNITEPVAPSIFAEYAKLLYANAEKYGEFGYLFRTQATLCDTLIEKFDLGVRTRALYEAGDKEGLRALDADYATCITKLECFYEAFRDQWDTVNKPYGFELQDSRLGGLLLRMKACRRRLLAYCDGTVQSIPELEEPVLEHDGGNAGPWINAVSAGTLFMNCIAM